MVDQGILCQSIKMPYFTQSLELLKDHLELNKAKRSFRFEKIKVVNFVVMSSREP